jgi:hypothetical protein
MLKRYAYKRAKMRQTNGLRNVYARLMLTLLFFVGLLSGCQTQPIQPCVNPAIPSPPAQLMEPPSQSYSASAQADMEKWRSKLTGGATMQ